MESLSLTSFLQPIRFDILPEFDGEFNPDKLFSPIHFPIFFCLMESFLLSSINHTINSLIISEWMGSTLFTAHPIWRQAGSGWRVHISKAGLPLSQIGGVAFEKCDAPQKEFVRQKVIYLFRIILTAPYIPASFPRTASLKSVSRDAWNAAGL